MTDNNPLLKQFMRSEYSDGLTTAQLELARSILDVHHTFLSMGFRAGRTFTLRRVEAFMKDSYPVESKGYLPKIGDNHE